MQANKINWSFSCLFEHVEYVISYFCVTMLVEPIKDIAGLGQYYLDYLVYVGGHIGFNDNIMVKSHQ